MKFLLSIDKMIMISGIACWLDRRFVISRLRVRIPAGAAGEFSSPESTLCADSYSVSVPPRVTAVARKRPRSFCQKCWWQVTPKHAYTLDPTKSEWADYAAVQTMHGNVSGNELTRNLSWNIRPQSSQLAEPCLLYTSPSPRDMTISRMPSSA